jgi:hypothetical protein
VLGIALAVTHWGIYQIYFSKLPEDYSKVPWYFLRFPYKHGLQGSSALVDELGAGAAALALARAGLPAGRKMVLIAAAGTWAMLFCLALDPLMVVNGVWTRSFAGAMQPAAVGSAAAALALALGWTAFAWFRPMDENHPSSG